MLFAFRSTAGRHFTQDNLRVAQVPQLQGFSYLAVEELVAIVDTNSRRIISVMQRMRRQENSKSG